MRTPQIYLGSISRLRGLLTIAIVFFGQAVSSQSAQPPKQTRARADRAVKTVTVDEYVAAVRDFQERAQAENLRAVEIVRGVHSVDQIPQAISDLTKCAAECSARLTVPSIQLGRLSADDAQRLRNSLEELKKEDEQANANLPQEIQTALQRIQSLEGMTPATWLSFDSARQRAGQQIVRAITAGASQLERVQRGLATSMLMGQTPRPQSTTISNSPSDEQSAYDQDVYTPDKTKSTLRVTGDISIDVVIGISEAIERTYPQPVRGLRNRNTTTSSFDYEIDPPIDVTVWAKKINFATLVKVTPEQNLVEVRVESKHIFHLLDLAHAHDKQRQEPSRGTMRSNDTEVTNDHLETSPSQPLDNSALEAPVTEKAAAARRTIQEYSQYGYKTYLHLNEVHDGRSATFALKHIVRDLDWCLVSRRAIDTMINDTTLDAATRTMMEQEYGQARGQLEKKFSTIFAKLGANPEVTTVLEPVFGRPLSLNHATEESLRQLQFPHNSIDEAQIPGEGEFQRILFKLQAGDFFNTTEAMEQLQRLSPEACEDTATRTAIVKALRPIVLNDLAVTNEEFLPPWLRWGGDAATKDLMTILKKSPPNQVDAAIRVLGTVTTPEVAQAIAPHLANPFANDEAAATLRKIGAPAEAALLQAAKSLPPQAALVAVEILGEVGTPKSLTFLRQASRSKSPIARDASLSAIQAIQGRHGTSSESPDEGKSTNGYQPARQSAGGKPPSTAKKPRAKPTKASPKQPEREQPTDDQEPPFSPDERDNNAVPKKKTRRIG